MKYLFSDFYLLVAAADKGCRTVGDAYRRMAELMGIPVSPSCLLHALRGLVGGGYLAVTPENGVITVDTPLAVQNAGREAATVSGLQRLLGEAKAFNKKELRFCAQDSPANEAPWTVDGESFASLADGLLRSRTVFLPLFDLKEEGEGQLTLTLHHPGQDYIPPSEEEEEEQESAFAADPDEAAQADTVHITGAAQTVLQAVSHLLEAALSLMASPRTHKVALHGDRGSYVVTLAHAATEYGLTLRMTVAPIRFNRQRFYGKRDSDLDYAQCGAPLLTLEMGDAKEFAARLLPCSVSLPERLEDGDRQVIGAIHGRLKG